MLPLIISVQSAYITVETLTKILQIYSFIQKCHRYLFFCRYEDLSPSLGWGACALPLEFYTTELPRVHSSTHTSSIGSPVPLEVSMHEESTSAFLQESAASWSAQSVLPPAYTAAENPSFANDNPSFQPVMEDSNAKVDLSSLELPHIDSPEEERKDEKEEARKVPTDFSDI